MKAIENWFTNSKDYYVGVALYASLPNKKSRTLKQLNSRKNQRNMSVLVTELRKVLTTPIKPQSRKVVLPIKNKAITQAVINTEALQKQQLNQAVKQEFGGIKLGELPAELRIRYSRAYNIYIQMVELKFALNALPGPAEQSALKIQIELEKLDNERDLIWKELHHWKTFKTLLPSKTDDFKDLTPLQLDRKLRNFKSNITKIGKRVDLLYVQLDGLTVPSEIVKIENKINKSEKLIHQHQINVAKIKELI